MSKHIINSRNSDPFTALGVRTFINCCGTRTLFGGSAMLSDVREAMAAASESFVSMDELMEAAAARLAALTGAEWGIVTCGSAAGVALATAACVAGNDPAKIARLPRTEGMPNKALMLNGQRFVYDHAIRMAGVDIVEVASEAEFEAALDPSIALIAILGRKEAESFMPLERIVELARPRKIPILVDAASEHIERPNPWLRRGADLVIYSGGKYLKAPQTSGLLLGSKPLVDSAWRNSAPHHGLGRPMKVSKEDIIGIIAALEYWFEHRNQATEEEKWRSAVSIVADQMAAIDAVSSEIIEPAGFMKVPKLRVSWDGGRYGLGGAELRQLLLDGTPRIMVDDISAKGNSIVIDPFNLRDGEAELVGRAVAAALTTPTVRGHTGKLASGPVIAGVWNMIVEFQRGERELKVQLDQIGDAITGSHSSQGFSGSVSGQTSADSVDLILSSDYEGNRLSYSLQGYLKPDGELAGTALFGATNDYNNGPVNRRQYGEGKWSAIRAH